MQRERACKMRKMGVCTLGNEGRCSVPRCWLFKKDLDMSENEMVSVKAKDYLALCAENEKLKKEVEKLRKRLDGSAEKKPSKNALNMGIVRADMQPVVERWLRYKRERGQSYKTTGFSSFVNKLMKLSGGNVNLATQIVEESISNNWSGIFSLKNNATRMPVGFVQTDNSQNKYKEQTLW